MRSTTRLLLLAVAGALVAGEAAAATVALLPVRRGVRELEVTGLVEQTLAGELAARATLVEAERTRGALRRLRLRAPDNASEAQLLEVATGLGAEWLVSVAVHDASTALVPDLTLSARLYDGRTGRLVWAGSVGRSGLDRRRLLGLGIVESLEALVPGAVGDLLAPLLTAVDAGGVSSAPAPAARRDVLAIVPFTAIGTGDGVEVATAATETMRAVLADAGVAMAQPGCVVAALRRPEGVRWGELDAVSRQALRANCAATLLVTGAVERWEIAGSGVAPEPIVAVAVRLLDVASGRIEWAGSLESGGWDRQGWFGAGRVFSRGDHLRRLLAKIGDQMLAAEPAVRVMKESS
jgi:hypothetical protein